MCRIIVCNGIPVLYFSGMKSDQKGKISTQFELQYDMMHEIVMLVYVLYMLYSHSTISKHWMVSVTILT